MKSNVINILCSTDDNYVPYCGIMLTSLFESNKDIKFEVYLFTEFLNEDNLLLLQQLASVYNNSIYVKYVDDTIVEKFPIKLSDHVSLATYYRLFAPDLLPESVHKIVYLDCDMIVNGNVFPLWNEDISGYALGAVDDESVDSDVKYQRLKYSSDYGYFNAGVLLLNLDYWRRHNVMEKCLKYISDFPERLMFHDQDVLNAVLFEEKKNISLKYNFQTGFIYRSTILTQEMRKCVFETINESPVIIHYTGPYKPWHLHSQHPYKDFFLHYKNLSLWGKKMPKFRVSIKNELIRLMNSGMWLLGLKKRPKTYIIEKQKFK